MKELLKEIATYNTWANRRLFDFIRAQPEEQMVKEVPSSFRTIYKTVLHMWDAQTAWWQRIKMSERLVLPGETFAGKMTELISGIMHQTVLWDDQVNHSSFAQLEHVCQYQNNKREVIKMPVYQIAFHVFNHDTYHRGQLVNMLRQLEADKIPQLDFSVWTRTRKLVN